jgi:DNA-binding MarR family transcriptional regulator
VTDQSAPDVRRGRKSAVSTLTLEKKSPAVGATSPPTLVYLVGRVDRGIRRELQRRLVNHELSIPELTTLSVLQRRPGLSNAQLARRALITPQSMNDVVAGLEQRGLVERRVDPSHNRILQTRLTPAGRGMLRRVTPIVEALQADLLQDVPDEDREVVIQGLVAAMRRLSEHDVHD